MSGSYRIVPTAGFQSDVARLEDHIVEFDLASDAPDEQCLVRLQDALRQALALLTWAPHTCRRSEGNRAFREVIVPFGRAGCIVLFAVRGQEVVLLAARDQHENDFR